METEIIELIIEIAAITFFTRFVFAVKPGKAETSQEWRKSYLPIAIFTTIIVPSLLAPYGELELSIQNEYLIAGIVTLLAAHKKKNLTHIVIIGILVVFLLRFFQY